MEVGAKYKNGGCLFTVWAPQAKKMTVKLVKPVERQLPMESVGKGYWQVFDANVEPGCLYWMRIDENRERPDPASFYQPEGVHGPSAVVDHAEFHWTDGSWTGIPQENLILYELHIGTFTPEGSFSAVIPRLGDLRELGITAIEIMPVAQFPGSRNWGYDGVCPFAVQNSYGGFEGLKQLVNACHEQGLAVILDVVYNHFGPEGNYLRDFGPYFTTRYRTPWGEAINYDGSGSDEVRNYFLKNALHWYRDYHVDGLRLDAIHAIFDFSARPFLQELSQTIEEAAKREGRLCHILAESDLNDVRVLRSREMGGYGLDGQFNEDFHHALHHLLTGESQGYFADYDSVDDLAVAYRQGFVYDWRYSPYRQRHHGSSSAGFPPRKLVVFSQNHDQIGNRRLGERLVALVGLEKAKLAAAAVLLAPNIPMLFMGEEYGEKAPFLYFTDFSDPDLIEAVRKGRHEEFQSFAWEGHPPDPHDPELFAQSKLDWDLRKEGCHQILHNLYVRIIRLRRSIQALSSSDEESFEVSGMEEERVIWFRRQKEDSEILCFMNFGENAVKMTVPEESLQENWQMELDTADLDWQGTGSAFETDNGFDLAPWSCRLYRKENLPRSLKDEQCASR